MLPLVIQIPGMRAGNQIGNVTWRCLRETSASLSPPTEQLTRRGAKSLVNRGGSGLPLVHLLGGGIIFLKRRTIFVIEAAFCREDQPWAPSSEPALFLCAFMLPYLFPCTLSFKTAPLSLGF